MQITPFKKRIPNGYKNSLTLIMNNICNFVLPQSSIVIHMLKYKKHINIYTACACLCICGRMREKERERDTYTHTHIDSRQEERERYFIRYFSFDLL